MKNITLKIKGSYAGESLRFQGNGDQHIFDSVGDGAHMLHSIEDAHQKRPGDG